jgi:multidrug transporter EmrE-like cation transporter
MRRLQLVASLCAIFSATAAFAGASVTARNVDTGVASPTWHESVGRICVSVAAAVVLEPGAQLTVNLGL